MTMEWKRRDNTSMIVIHNPHPDDENNVFHVRIARNGDCEVPYPIDRILDHLTRYNEYAVGICLDIDPGDQTVGLPPDPWPSRAQTQVLTALCFAVINLYKLTPADVHRHAQHCAVLDIEALRNDLNYLTYGKTLS